LGGFTIGDIEEVEGRWLARRLVAAWLGGGGAVSAAGGWLAASGAGGAELEGRRRKARARRRKTVEAGRGSVMRGGRRSTGSRGSPNT
jgi:hypothetical protein